MNSRCHKTAVF